LARRPGSRPHFELEGRPGTTDRRPRRWRATMALRTVLHDAPGERSRALRARAAAQRRHDLMAGFGRRLRRAAGPAEATGRGPEWGVQLRKAAGRLSGCRPGDLLGS